MTTAMQIVQIIFQSVAIIFMKDHIPMNIKQIINIISND